MVLSILKSFYCFIIDFFIVTDCEGRGEKPCPTCNAGQEHGFYKANQMTRCGACHGRGLLAHQDGSDSVLVVLLPQI